MPAASPQAAMAPPYFVIESRLASVVEPTLSIAARPALLRQRLGRPRQLIAIDHLGRAEPLQIVGLRHAAGGCDDVVAELRQHRGRDRADAAGGAGDDDRTVLRA